jgi:hypothetical protein
VGDCGVGFRTFEIGWGVFSEFEGRERSRLLKLCFVPNPFLSSEGLSITYTLPYDVDRIRIKIYSLSGEIVYSTQDCYKTLGGRDYKIKWSGKNTAEERIASGIYFCLFEYGKEAVVKSIVCKK